MIVTTDCGTDGSFYSTKQEPEGFGVPILTMLLEGGTGAIYELKASLDRGEPCVIIEGSGRAADILAYGYKNAVKIEDYQNKGYYFLKQGHINHLEKMLKETFDDEINEENKTMFIDWILGIIKYSDRITLFNINNEEDQDKQILSALLKDENFTVQNKMMMTLMWNRPDIAENMIFNDSNREFRWRDRPFDEVMSQALLRDGVGFVEMLILNGFSFQWFLTVSKLRELYNEAANIFPELMDQLESHIGHDGSKIYLSHIHKYLTIIMKRHRHTLYECDRSPSDIISDGLIANSSFTKTFEDPHFEMFIWCVLTNRSNLVEFFWSRTEHPVVAAMFASTLYGFLHHDSMYRNRSTSQRLHDQKQYYLDTANNIMELAYKKDRDKAIELVERKSERFGNKCLLDLAFTGHLKSFIGNTPCHDAISNIWKRGFIKISKRWALLTILCPFLLLTPKFKFLPLGDDGGELTFLQKVYVFYKAPIVKYIGHAVNYTFFLMFYTSTALFHFNWEFNLIEIIVYIWFFTMIADEIREILRMPSKKLTSKFKEHLEGFWNRLDLFIYVIAVTGFVLKNWEETFPIARVMFACNSFLLYMRFFRIYHASLKLGPKLVIMHRMLPEISSFLLLLIIVILGYGTAREALLNSYNNFNVTYVPEILNDVFFVPIWEMLGELNVEEIVATNEEVCYEDGRKSFESFIMGNQKTIPKQLALFNNHRLNEHGKEYCEVFTHYEPIVKVFLAVYMLIANVMLLNLLIAVFTTIFSHVQENSKVVWRYEKYRLVEEFSTKPFLAPPLVIFELLNRLLRHIWNKISPPKTQDLDLLFSGLLKSVNLFEKDCSKSYMKKKMLDDDAKIETKIAKAVERRLKDMESSKELKQMDKENDYGDFVSTRRP